MSSDRRTVFITRHMELEVTVTCHHGESPSWDSPGEPEEYTIYEALDDCGRNVQLEADEMRQAIESAIAAGPDLGPPDEDDDRHKPF